MVWGAQVPQKIKQFVWKVCHNILPVRENLHKKRIANTGICLVCNKETETVEHTLLFCEWTRPIWFGVQFQLVPDRANTTTISKWFEQRINLLQDRRDLKEFAIISIMCTFWSIWKGRNQCVFEGKQPDPLQVIQQIHSSQNEYANLKKESMHTGEQLHNQNMVTTKVWRPPLLGVVKVNSDARFLKSNGSGCSGIIIRNDRGKVLSGLTGKFYAASALTAEAIALREAVNLAQNLHLQSVVFESDNLELIRNCRGEEISGEIQNIIQDIQSYRRNFIHTGFTWVHRQGNEVAHHLALMESRNLLLSNWRWNTPASLETLLQIDSRNCRVQVGTPASLADGVVS